MSLSTSNPLCPACRARMVQTVPGANGVWACPSHGDFTGGTGNGSTAGATVQGDAETATGATSGDLVVGM